MLANWVKESTGTIGTGTISLGGAEAGHVPFSAAFVTGSMVLYSIEDGNNRETGLGLLASGSPWTLARTKVFETLVGGVYDGAPASAIALSGAAKVFVADAVQAFGPNTVTAPGMTSGVLRPPSVLGYNYSGKAGGEFSSSAGRIVLQPFTAFTPLKITALGANVTTASAGGLFRIGIYTKTYDHKPGALIVDSGNLSTTATGQILATLGSPLYLPAGRYFAADAVDNTTAAASGMRSSAAMQGDNWYGTSDPLTADSKPYKNQAYGAMPASIGAVDGHIQWASFGMIWK